MEATWYFPCGYHIVRHLQGVYLLSSLFFLNCLFPQAIKWRTCIRQQKFHEARKMEVWKIFRKFIN
jgi:hypothetical protein